MKKIDKVKSGLYNTYSQNKFTNVISYVGIGGVSLGIGRIFESNNQTSEELVSLGLGVSTLSKLIFDIIDKFSQGYSHPAKLDIYLDFLIEKLEHKEFEMIKKLNQISEEILNNLYEKIQNSTYEDQDKVLDNFTPSEILNAKHDYILLIFKKNNINSRLQNCLQQFDKIKKYKSEIRKTIRRG